MLCSFTDRAWGSLIYRGIYCRELSSLHPASLLPFSRALWTSPLDHKSTSLTYSREFRVLCRCSQVTQGRRGFHGPFSTGQVPNIVMHSGVGLLFWDFGLSLAPRSRASFEVLASLFWDSVPCIRSNASAGHIGVNFVTGLMVGDRRFPGASILGMTCSTSSVNSSAHSSASPFPVGTPFLRRRESTATHPLLFRRSTSSHRCSSWTS